MQKLLFTILIFNFCLCLTKINDENLGFKAEFPIEVEKMSINEYMTIFMGEEKIDGGVIAFQILVTNESPMDPIGYLPFYEGTKWLADFYNSLKLQHDPTTEFIKPVYSTFYSYPSIDFEFEFSDFGISFSSKGKIILLNGRFIKITMLYSKELIERKIINNKIENFFNSFDLKKY